jgi:septum formation protein
MMQSEIILASTSRYRAALLTQLGVPFSVFKSEIDEIPRAGESPRATCERLAIEKARNAAATMGKHALIIGSDQVLDYDGEAVSKPGNFEMAFSQLKRAQGRALVSYTALALLDTRTSKIWSDVVPTTVRYRNLTDAELIAYLRREEPYDCAGSVKVETAGIALLQSVSSDDPTALVGLPLIRLTDFLREAGYTFTR